MVFPEEAVLVICAFDSSGYCYIFSVVSESETSVLCSQTGVVFRNYQWYVHLVFGMIHVSSPGNL